MQLSSPIINGDLGRRSGGIPKSSLPVTERGPRLSRRDPILPYLDLVDLIPEIPDDGNFKAEFENTLPDGDLKQISDMRWDSSLADYYEANLPEPPPGLFSKAKASEMLRNKPPHAIRGPNGRVAYIVYTPPTSYKRTDNAGIEYPKAPPNYATVVRDRKGIFYNHDCKRNPCLVEWHAVDQPWYAYM